MENSRTELIDTLVQFVLDRCESMDDSIRVRLITRNGGYSISETKEEVSGPKYLTNGIFGSVFDVGGECCDIYDTFVEAIDELELAVW